MNVCAVVVTRNRRELLVECLSALREQTRPPDHILVVDNASTDGTGEMLREEHRDIESFRLPVNEGGAGGFHEGICRARADDPDWIWLMDDDTIPTPTCLEELLRAAERVSGSKPALLSSKVVWTDGRLHPMNQPGLERERTDVVVRASELGLMPLRTATFVSLLVSREAVDAFGLPLRRYFLWSDDIEYTARILRRAAGYLVPASVAVHKTRQPHTAVSASSSDLFYFHVRNTLYTLRGPAWARHEKPSVVYLLLSTIVAYLRANRSSPRVLKVVLRGVCDGLKPGAPTPARP